MRPTILLVVTTGLIAAVSACSPVYYVPNSHNVPILQSRGDGSIAARASTLGVEVQGAYAISDHIGLMVNGAGGHQVNESQQNPGSGDQVFLEAGVVNFHSFGRFVWENYALLGVGHVKNDLEWTVRDSPGTTGKIEADFVRFGVQPSLAWRSRHFDAIASLRLSGLKHSNVSGNLVFDHTNQVSYLDSIGNQFLLEPALTIRAGRDPLKLSLQMGTSRNLTHENFHQVDNVASLAVVYTKRRAQ
jgi:hypothetical protein